MALRKLQAGARLDRSAPEAVDCYVGQRVRERRIMLGLTQRELADLVDITYQQVNRYETGHNRMSAGRLFVIAEVLDVGVDYFVTGVDDQQCSETMLQQRVLLDLSRNFIAMPCKHQGAICALARAFAHTELALIVGNDTGPRRETVAT